MTILEFGGLKDRTTLAKGREALELGRGNDPWSVGPEQVFSRAYEDQSVTEDFRFERTRNRQGIVPGRTIPFYRQKLGKIFHRCRIAQLAERLTLDQEVLGSSPSLAANIFKTPVQIERAFFVVFFCNLLNSTAPPCSQLPRQASSVVGKLSLELGKTLSRVSEINEQKPRRALSNNSGASNKDDHVNVQISLEMTHRSLAN